MDQTLLIALIIAAVVVVAIAAFVFFMVRRRNRQKDLERDFGPEYGHVVEEEGDRGRGEAVLRERRERVNEYELRELSTDERRQLWQQWDLLIARFPEHPGETLREADRFLDEALRVRGYRSGSVEERGDDISVGHGEAAEEYRQARDIYDRDSRGDATTEDLRQGVLHYQRVIARVVAGSPGETATADGPRAEKARVEGR